MSRPGATDVGRLLLPSGLLLLLLPLYLGLLPWAFDDAYIHLKMAANLAAGQGPFVNAGDAVNASSAPLWTLYLGLLAAVGAAAPFWVAVTNAILTAVGAAIFVALAGRLGERPLGVGYRLLFATAYCAVLHYAGAGMMETPAALLCLGLGLLAWADARPVCALLLVLACFLRLELAAIAGLLLVESLLTRRIDRRRTVLWALAGGLPLVVYQLYYFGSLIPHTAQAKALVYELSYAQALGVLTAFSAPSLAPFDIGLVRWISLVALVAVAATGLVRRCAEARSVSAGRLALLALGTLAIPLVYVATRSLAFPWYPPLFVIPGLLLLFATARRSRHAWPALVVALVGLLPYTLDLVPSALAVFTQEPPRYRYFAVNARVRSYLKLGRQLAHAYPGARLLSSEIGALGYTHDGEIVDAMGLVSPGALAFHPMQVPQQRSSGLFGSIPAAFVEQEQPDLIVSMEPFMEEFVRSPVAANYRHYRLPLYVAADRVPGTTPMLWGSRSISLFVRRDLPEWSEAD